VSLCVCEECGSFSDRVRWGALAADVQCPATFLVVGDLERGDDPSDIIGERCHHGEAARQFEHVGHRDGVDAAQVVPDAPAVMELDVGAPGSDLHDLGADATGVRHGYGDASVEEEAAQGIPSEAFPGCE